MLDERQQFKAAFIMRCIENGYTTPEEIVGKVKEAREKVAIVPGLGRAASTVAGLGTLGIGGALLAPPALGWLAGNQIGQTKNLNDIDADEVKRQELIDELRKQTERLRRRKLQPR